VIEYVIASAAITADGVGSTRLEIDEFDQGFRGEAFDVERSCD
ncbi:hypothetical protein Tco_0754867, partial [Tanacetum coccineum]